MAAEFELLGTEKAGAVIGTTTHSELDVSLYGLLKRTEYMTFAAGSTYIMSTGRISEPACRCPAFNGRKRGDTSDGSGTR